MEEEKIIEKPHSVKIAINAKGFWSGEVKVYAESSDEAMKDVLLKAEILNDLIKVKNEVQE